MVTPLIQPSCRILLTDVPLSSVSVCCLPNKETIVVYGGFATSPTLTATHFLREFT